MDEFIYDIVAVNEKSKSVFKIDIENEFEFDKGEWTMALVACDLKFSTNSASLIEIRCDAVKTVYHGSGYKKLLKNILLEKDETVYISREFPSENLSYIKLESGHKSVIRFKVTDQSGVLLSRINNDPYSSILHLRLKQRLFPDIEIDNEFYTKY